MQAKGLRVRQHINPLRTKFQTLRPAPEWSTTYADCTLPLVVDIGSAGGRFVLAMAKKHPEYNFLGLEIRNPVSHHTFTTPRTSGKTCIESLVGTKICNRIDDLHMLKWEGSPQSNTPCARALIRKALRK